jgi:hypothetical protein
MKSTITLQVCGDDARGRMERIDSSEQVGYLKGAKEVTAQPAGMQ